MCFAIFNHTERSNLLEAERNSRTDKMEVQRKAQAAGYKLWRKTHMLACGMKATFSMKNYISTT